MSYLWSFQSFSQEKFDAFVDDRARVAATLKAELDAAEAAARHEAELGLQQWRERPALARLCAYLLGRGGPPRSYAPLRPNGERILDHIAKWGLEYNGLSVDESQTLDAFVQMLFPDDGRIRAELQMEPESPEGVHGSLVEAVMARGRDLVYLSILDVGGRRFGSDVAQHCEYCLFAPDEVRCASAEIERCLSSDAAWPKPYLEDVAWSELGEVFTTIARKGKAAFGILG